VFPDCWSILDCFCWKKTRKEIQAEHRESGHAKKKVRKIHVLDKKMGYVTYYNRITKELE